MDIRGEGLATWDAKDQSIAMIEGAADKESTQAKNVRILKQVLFVFAVSIAHLNMGIITTFQSSFMADRRKDNSTIMGYPLHLTPTQKDMFGSLVSVGVLPGTWMAAWMLVIVGRRWSMLLVALPGLLGWVMVLLATNPAVMLIGRFLAGVYIGMSSVAGGVYIVELSDINIRGALSTITSIMVNLGFIAAVMLGLWLPWYHIPFVAMALILGGEFAVLLIPESPTFLVVKGCEKEAKTIIRKLRGPNVDVEDEVEVLKSSNQDKTKKPLLTVLRQPEVLRPLLVMQVLFFLVSFSGFSVVLVNTNRIFHEAGSSLDEETATVLVFMVQLLGSLMSTILLDRIGRRWSIIASLGVMVVCLCVMATYTYMANEASSSGVTSYAVTPLIQGDLRGMFEEQWGWLPLACLMVFMFFSSLGIGSVPWLLNAEYFPTAVRAQAGMVGEMGGSLYSFAALQLYTPMQQGLTTPGLFWFYSGIGLLGAIFCLVYVTETNNINVG